jgi:hypothetical protein
LFIQNYPIKLVLIRLLSQAAVEKQ